jgi:rRNA maturation protein Nop10
VAYKCPRCGLVYEKSDMCPLCGWLINVPFRPDKPTQPNVPKMKCPECGEEMEQGTFQITNDYLLPGYDIRWFQMDEKIGQGLGDMFFHANWIRKPGAICRECSLVILRWEDLAKPKEPIPDKPLK